MNQKIGVLLLAGLLVACNSKPKTNDVENDTDHGEPEPKEVSVKKPAISDEVKNFTSPDLSLYDLHAKVDYAVITTYVATKEGNDFKQGVVETIDSIYFNADGRLIREVKQNCNEESWDKFNTKNFMYTPEGKLKKATLVVDTSNDKINYKLKVSRNSNDYIKSIVYLTTNLSEEANYEERYVWKDGRLDSCVASYWEALTIDSYEYDADKCPFKHSYVYEDYDGCFTVKSTSRFTAFDECHNWTRCNITRGETYQEWEKGDGESPKLSDSKTTYAIKERQIVYQE